MIRWPTVLITFMICILALPVIKRQAGEEASKHAYRLKGGFAIPLLALIVCIWMAAQSSLDSWLYVAGLFALGLALYGLETRLLRKS